MNDQPAAGALTVAPLFAQFVESELLPAIGMSPADFWAGLESIISDLTPLNRSFLEKRAEIQHAINDWHLERQGQAWRHDEYVEFLRQIGYLVPGGEPFEIETDNVDREIAEVAGPQLVVPVSNARFALNAANARWGSLYDALYGTDAISEENGQQRGGEYNPARGAAVIRYATEFLDATLPLDGVSHADVNEYGLDRSDDGDVFLACNSNSHAVALVDPAQYVGHREKGSRHTYLFCNNGLHIELVVDP